MCTPPPCRRTMPQVQRLIDYMEDALVDLEVAAGINVAPKKKAAARKAKAKSAAKARRELRKKS